MSRQYPDPRDTMATVLDAYAITTALTDAPVATHHIPTSTRALIVQSQFDYGTGGLGAALFVDTSYDGGVLWVPIQLHTFAPLSDLKFVGVCRKDVSANRTRNAAASPVPNGIVNGILGKDLRLRLTTTGTFTSTTLTVKIITE